METNEQPTNQTNKQVKIELLSQSTLEAEFRKTQIMNFYYKHPISN